MEQLGSEVKAIKVEEIKRQKVYVPKSMTTNQVMEKYGLKPGAAYSARKKGFYVKNYSCPQVCIDPSKFNVDPCDNIAGKVFKSNLSRDPVAMSIRDDLIQEAVKSMWEKTGLLKESKKYSIGCSSFCLNGLNKSRKYDFTAFLKFPASWLSSNPFPSL